MKLQNKSIILRSDGRWQGSYYTNGHRCYVYDKTQKGCYIKLRNKLYELQHKTVSKHTTQRSSEYKTLNDWIQKWIELYKVNTLKESTLYKLRITMRKYVQDSIGKKCLQNLQALDFLEFLNKIKLNRTRQLVYINLKDCLKRAVDNNIIAVNPMTTLPTPKHIKKERRALSEEEETLFIAAANNSKYKELYYIMLYAGLRIGEALALRGTDVKDTYFYVDESRSDFKISDTKNHKARKVPIFKELEFLKSKDKTSDKLLYNSDRHQVYDDFVKLCKAAKITDMTMHGLRHTFATNCARKNITPKQVQLWLGHSDVGVTLKYYTNIDSDFEKQNIEKKNSYVQPRVNK